MEIRVITPQEITSFRAERGWTQAKLAERLRVGTRAVQEWEGGRRSVPLMLGLVLHHIRMIEELEHQVRMMRDGSITLRQGNTDITPASLKQAEGVIADYERLIGNHVWGEDVPAK